MISRYLVKMVARIFVSSTFEDLKEYREKVRFNLKRLDHEDVAMECFVAEDQRPIEKCLKDVVSCDLFIGILFIDMVIRLTNTLNP